MNLRRAGIAELADAGVLDLEVLVGTVRKCPLDGSSGRFLSLPSYWTRSWIAMVTNPTVVPMADIPIRIAQARRKRSSMIARIMRAPSQLYPLTHSISTVLINVYHARTDISFAGRCWGGAASIARISDLRNRLPVQCPLFG